MLELVIMDDGYGFDPTKVVERKVEGFGLHSMRQRAEALGGSLDVISQITLGTQVVVQVPIQMEKARSNLDEIVISG
jgi:signal transduction histidine kinase